MAKYEIIKESKEKVGKTPSKKKQNGPATDKVKGQHKKSDLQMLNAPSDVTTDVITGLQRTHGNAYVQRLLKSRAVQAKMSVNPPNDIYEKEADQVAEIVSKKPTLDIQRQENKEEEEVQTKPASAELISRLQKQAVPEEDEVQTKPAGAEIPEVSGELEGRINAARGSGEALPDSIRASFEPQFGRDFSNVRLHTNAEAHDLSHQLGARAFTTGQDIFFRSGDYQPESDEGRKLLGHEMTHVVQQGAADISRQPAETKTEEKAPETPEVKAERGLRRAVDKLRTEITREYMKELLKQATTCQLLGMEAQAQEAIKEATDLATAMLKSKVAMLDVQLDTRDVVVDLLKATEYVMALGGDEKAIEAAISKALAWAQAQLDLAMRNLQAAPSKENLIMVIKRADLVYMLGGDISAAQAAITKWVQTEQS